MASDRDDQLLARAASGDDEALRELLVRHGPATRDILHVGPQWQSIVDPDDVMQVTYLEVCLHIANFRPAGPGSFAAWLKRLAENNLRDALREQGRDKRPPPGRRITAPDDDDSHALLWDYLALDSGTPSRIARADERRKAVEQAIRALPPDYATAVRLYHFDGLTGTQVAQSMGRSVGAVRMLLARAHDRLRDVLAGSTKFLS